MKVYIVCDLEGTAGVTSFEHQQWIPGQWYNQARRLATLELNAAVEGCLEAGATEIVAWDGHGNFPAAAEEARSLTPNVETAVVKWGYAQNAALSLAPQKAREVIREGVRLVDEFTVEKECVALHDFFI